MKSLLRIKNKGTHIIYEIGIMFPDHQQFKSNDSSMKTMFSPIKYLISMLVLSVSLCICSTASCDPFEDFVSANLRSTDSYGKDVSEYIEKTRNKKAVTDADRLRYSNAYAYQAWDYYRRNDAENAMKAALLAVNLSPKNPTALFVTGCLYEIKRDYANAAAYFQSASNLAQGRVKESSLKQLDGVAAKIIGDAQNLINEKRFIEAGERLQFIATRYRGARAEDAAKLLQPLKGEITAWQKLLQARQFISFRNQGAAKRLLNEINTDYPETAAAEEAKKLLNLYVEVKGGTGLAEYARNQKWKVLETANFAVYYHDSNHAKRTSKLTEDVFSKVTSEFGLKNISWENSKCRIFLLDDDNAWSYFGAALGGVPDWSGAFAVRGAREIYANANDKDFLLESSIPHEITHIIHAEYLGKNGVAPLWLVEGIAKHQEFGSKRIYYKIVSDCIKNGNYISLKELTALTNYPSTVDKVRYFYSASLSFVEFIIEKYGINTYIKLNSEFKDKSMPVLEFEKICSQFLNEKPDVVEKKWIDFVKSKK